MDDPPFDVDGTVHEEDTWLALSAPTDLIAPPDHPVRVMTGAWKAEPLEPGSVIVRVGKPARILAVVHDLDADPSWQRAWVAKALTGVFEGADEHGLGTLRLPLLGCEHGALPVREFADLLREQLLRRRGRGAVRRLWLPRADQPASELMQAITDS